MIFLRRDRSPNRRWVVARVGLFFLAAGMWLAGVAIGSERITIVAIGVAFLGLVVGQIGRRRQEKSEEERVQGSPEAPGE